MTKYRPALLLALIVPAVTVPSPQSMLADRFAAVSPVSVSRIVATVRPLVAAPAVASNA